MDKREYYEKDVANFIAKCERQNEIEKMPEQYRKKIIESVKAIDNVEHLYNIYNYILALN